MSSGPRRFCGAHLSVAQKILTAWLEKLTICLIGSSAQSDALRAHSQYMLKVCVERGWQGPPGRGARQECQAGVPGRGAR